MSIPATPRASGRIVFHEDQENITYPQVMGIKKLVAEAVSKKALTQSHTASLEYNEPDLLFNLKRKIIAIRLISYIIWVFLKSSLLLNGCNSKKLDCKKTFPKHMGYQNQGNVILRLTGPVEMSGLCLAFATFSYKDASIPNML